MITPHEQSSGVGTLASAHLKDAVVICNVEVKIVIEKLCCTSLLSASVAPKVNEKVPLLVGVPEITKNSLELVMAP